MCVFLIAIVNHVTHASTRIFVTTWSYVQHGDVDLLRSWPRYYQDVRVFLRTSTISWGVITFCVWVYTLIVAGDSGLIVISHIATVCCVHVRFASRLFRSSARRH